MTTKVTIVLWDPKGRTEESWDKVAKALERQQGAAVLDVTTEEVEDD